MEAGQKQSVIGEYKTQVTNAIDGLGSRLTSLFVKLTPVLGPELPTGETCDKADKAKPPMESELANYLRNSRENIDDANGKLDEILARLQC